MISKFVSATFWMGVIVLMIAFGYFGGVTRVKMDCDIDGHVRLLDTDFVCKRAKVTYEEAV